MKKILVAIALMTPFFSYASDTNMTCTSSRNGSTHDVIIAEDATHSTFDDTYFSIESSEVFEDNSGSMIWFNNSIVDKKLKLFIIIPKNQVKYILMDNKTRKTLSIGNCVYKK